MLDPRTHQHYIPFQLYDDVETRRNRAHHSHHYYNNNNNTWESTDSVSWPLKIDTKSKKELEDDESGMCSPPLWTTSSPTSPSRDGRSIGNHYRSLSPASRTQAIVRGQRELMEMVRNMPESNYELSLKDLVEHHWVKQQDNTVMVDEKNLMGCGGGGSGRKVMGQVKRSGTLDRRSGGFYLKMAFPPFSLGSKDKKKKNKDKEKKKKKKEQPLGNGSSSKVLPRPSVSDGSGKGGGVEKEWWKKSPSGSRESDSGVSSINSESTKRSGSSSSSNSSNTSNVRHRHQKSGGRCWPCIPRSKKDKQRK